MTPNSKFIQGSFGKPIIVFLVWSGFLLMASCAGPASEFKDARKLDKIEGYEIFLHKYPSSEFSPQAETRIVELEYSLARQEDTADAYKEFLALHPDSNLAANARYELQRIEFGQAQEVDTKAAYLQFLTAWPNGEYSSEARGRIDEIDFAVAEQDNSIKAYRRYLAEYPNGASADIANSRLVGLVDEAFRRAKAVDTKAAYREFLNLKPSGAQAKEAAIRLETLEYEAVIESGNRSALVSYLATYPESSRNEDIVFRLAKLEGTDEAFLKFIKSYPESARFDEACVALTSHKVLRTGEILPVLWAPVAKSKKDNEFNVAAILIANVDDDFSDFSKARAANSVIRRNGNKVSIFCKVGSLLQYPAWVKLTDAFALNESAKNIWVKGTLQGTRKGLVLTGIAILNKK